VLIVDTEQTQITGDGVFDLEHETFDMKIEPKPKKPGILSLRTPVRLYGSFRNPEFALEKAPLALRAGAVIGLAVVNPLAVLIPLIETGPGAETDCSEVLGQVKGADQQARSPLEKARTRK
jgi:AsmA protein